MKAKERLTFLDSLRGLAAIYVVFFHVMTMPTPQMPAGPWLTPLVMGGGSGVALFFVLSAFSLFYTMPHHQATGRPLLSFYVHRFLRISPLFYCWLVFSLYRDGRGAHPGHTWPEVAANLSFTFNLFRGWEQGVVWASWAIGIEMLFYAIFPLIFPAIRSLGAAMTLMIATALAAALAGSGVLGEVGSSLVGSYGLLRHLPVFAAGITSYFIYLHLRTLPAAIAHRAGAVLGVLGTTTLAGLMVLHSQAMIQASTFWQTCGVCYALILVSLSQCPLQVVVNPITAALGKISYSIYLSHPVVIAVLAPAFRTIQSRVNDTTLSYLICAAVALLVTLLIAPLTYYLVEAPAIRLGRSLVTIWARRPPRPATLD